MRGRRDPQTTMLAFVDLEECVPRHHPLRVVKQFADRALRELSPVFDQMYAAGGRPSIPPERLHRECAARGLSKRTVEYVHTILHKALHQAVHDQLVPRNVAHKTRLPSSQRPKVAPYTPDEAIRFLEEVRGEPEETLYVVALGLGLRRGEALGLRWSDINWTARTGTIAGQLQRVSGEGVVWVRPRPTTRSPCSTRQSSCSMHCCCIATGSSS